MPILRRQAATAFAAFLRDEVLEPVCDAMWTFSTPRMIRPYFMHHRELLGKLCHAAYETVADLMVELLPRPGALARADASCGRSVVGPPTAEAGSDLLDRDLPRGVHDLHPLVVGHAQPELAQLVRRGQMQAADARLLGTVAGEGAIGLADVDQHPVLNEGLQGGRSGTDAGT